MGNQENMSPNPLQTSSSTPLIEDVASAGSNAEFRNDVQLAQYRTDHNLELARDFIFTRKAAAGRKSSTELLKYLCEAFMPGAPPNRFVFIATYGHGKSHFAVATANYFGKPKDSVESNGVLARIKNALQEVSLVGFFESFKRNNKPSLILILRGDEPSDLQTKFFRAVEEALRTDAKINGNRAPFWHTEAAAFLEGILKDSSVVKRANAFLESYQLDLEVLLDKVKGQEATTYDITRDLCVHLYHHRPDFGTGLSLKEGVEWLGANLVGADKPYGGVLILFDEFSSFVRDYALRIQHRPGAPLQDLLNGVESMRGKIAFVAFAQRDPELVARNLLTGDSLQSLTTQLNRLPKPQHYHLHSSLEEVLAAYLRQSSDAWQLLRRIPSFTRSLGQSSDLTFDIFGTRYAETLEWDIERFQRVVAEGCFPLHPATTALLSSVELETTNNPRSVLGFVTKHLDGLKGKLSIVGDRPNWVLPIELVDYFREMLGQKVWDDFTDAVAQAGGADATAPQVAILKAMLLQAAGKVATKGSYSRVIGLFAGLAVEIAASELKSLATSGVIRFEPSKGIYTFWPAGKGANKVDQMLLEKLQGHTLDNSVLQVLNARLRTEGLIENISVPVPWGHQEDWQAEQYFVSKETLTRKMLGHLASSSIDWRPEGAPLARGLVLWSIAETADDASWIRDAAPDALPEHNVPIVMMNPAIAHPELARQLLRFYGLTTFSNSDIAEVGQEQFSAVWQLSLESLKAGFESLKDNSEFVVPAGFKARIQATRVRDVESVLLEVFKMAYNAGPKRWFTQYKSSAAKLRNATSRVATYLLSNALDTPEIFAADNVSKEVAHLLKAEWSLLASDLRIKNLGASSNIRPAWDVLDGEFPAGGHSKVARLAIVKLLNAPYGFDYNTLSLVVASWLGFHRHDLEVSVNGQLRPLKALANDLKPKEFIELLASMSVRKTDADAVKTQVRELLTKVDRGTFSRTEAHDAEQLFSQALERDDVDQKPAIQTAAAKLASALLKAEQYDQAVAEIERQTETLKGLAELVRVLNSLSKLQKPVTVAPDRPNPDEVRSRVLQKVKIVTEATCSQYRQLNSIAHYTRNEEQLQNTRKILNAVQLLDMVGVVDAALSELDTTKKRLEQTEQDERSLAIIESVEARGSITQLKKSISAIESLVVFSEAARSTADRSLNSLRSELNRLEDLKASIPKRLDEVQDLHSLDVVNGDLLRNVNLLDDADAIAEVQENVDRCQKLKQLFEATTALKRDPRTKADADYAITELRTLLERSREYTTPVQQGLISEAIAEVNRAVQKHEDVARGWLDHCEQMMSTRERGDAVYSKLNSPPPFLPEALRDRLESLILRAKQEQEERRQEATSLAALGAVSTKGTMGELRRQIAVVQGLPAPSERVLLLVDKKLSELNSEVQRLREFKDRVPSRLDGIRDLTALNEVQSDLLRHVDQFEGTPEAAELSREVARSQQMRRFFEALESLRREPIRMPDDACGLQDRLHKLTTDTEFVLSAAQQTVVAEVKREIEDQVVRQSKSALQWFEDCERAAGTAVNEENLLSKLRTPPAFLVEVDRQRVEMLVSDLTQRLSTKRNEAASLAELSAIPLKGSIVEINERLALVRNIPASSPLLRQKIEERLESLNLELGRLQAFSAALASRLDEAHDPRQVERVQADVLRNVNLFDGADENSKLEQALERCAHLRELFDKVAEYTRGPIQTPTDAMTAGEKLRALAMGSAMWMSDLHRSVISDAIVRIDQSLGAKTSEAMIWLSDREHMLVDGCDPVTLLDSLKSPSPFLTGDGRARLDDLISQANHRIDSDEVLLVIKHFNQISDVSTRVECLARLNALVDEK